MVGATGAPHDLECPDLGEFVLSYSPYNRHDRTSTWPPEAPVGRWRSLAYDKLKARVKVNLDIFWLCNQTLSAQVTPQQHH